MSLEPIDWVRTGTVWDAPLMTVWPQTVGAKTIWRVWINGVGDSSSMFPSERAAKAYAESMAPFIELQRLK